MNESGDAAHSSRQNRCGGSEPAHAKDDLWFEFPIDRSAEREALVKATQKTKDGRRIKRWQPDGRQFLKAKRSSGKGQRIDLLLGNEKHHLMAARAQGLGHGKPGEKVTAGSATCNDRVHNSKFADTSLLVELFAFG